MRCSLEHEVTYTYEGPIPLGSVVHHYCAAVGLLHNQHKSRFIINAVEKNGMYELIIWECLYDEDEVARTKLISYEENASWEGRSLMGRKVLHFLRHYLGIEGGDWGDLVGVRPMKLYDKLLRNLASKDEVSRFLTVERNVSAKKVELLESVREVQAPYMSQEDDGYPHIYGGIPFCPSRCTYCSFPFGIAGQYKKMEDFVNTFIEDCNHVDMLLKQYNIEPRTLYLGGGTPTSLDDQSFHEVIAAFSKLRKLEIEFTVEAGRPDTINMAKLRCMKDYGVTRISINPQTMQDHILQRVGRNHRAEEIKVLYETVRNTTNFAINMDFIAGLPEQTLSHMEDNLDYVCQCRPENVTMHTLAIKKGSLLAQQPTRYELPTAEMVKAMIVLCHERLLAAGYVPYYVYRQQYMTGQLENIGYTLEGHECVYNIQMMNEKVPIVSVGPGSTSKWMRGPDFKQSKLYIPKNVDTYIDSFPLLCRKRENRFQSFYGKERHDEY